MILEVLLVPGISANASSTTVLVASEIQGGDLHHCKSHCLKTKILFYNSHCSVMPNRKYADSSVKNCPSPVQYNTDLIHASLCIEIFSHALRFGPSLVFRV